MKRQVRWQRPVEESFGVLLYRSHCGRFEIRRREYDLPVRSVGYRLSVDGKPHRDAADSLTAAKDDAEYVLNPNWEPDT